MWYATLSSRSPAFLNSVEAAPHGQGSAASVARGVERRPLVPLYPLPRGGPPFRGDTFHTAIESLRPGERLVFELVFSRGGSCDVSVFCRLAGS